MALEHSRHVRRPAGVLWPNAGTEVFETAQEPVPDPVSLVVDHYWWVSWRRDRVLPFRARVLGDPVAHLTVEDADGELHGHAMPAALVHGVVTRVFTVDLPVAGRVSGLAFRPGGLAALRDVDAGELTSRVVDASEVLGPGVAELRTAVLAEPDEPARLRLFLEYAAELLAPRLEQIADDPGYGTVREAVALMRGRGQVTLAPVASAVHVSPRTLQRLFAHYVGVSPLWVLRRYRLQDAARAIDSGDGADLADLAASLGFSDQAHFTRAFTGVIGVPPSRYRNGEPA
ncbi:AraC family transcriptional regulator [Georgenia halophila]|uniref:AraC family transcriptional regulator n=1 Tax=Georgenia halophila TaxID=620889 RepID=UPI0031EA7F84